MVDADFPQDAIDLSHSLAEAVAAGDQNAAKAALEGLKQIPGQASFIDRWAAMVHGPADSFGGPLQLVEK